jgi:hypothetical protein
MLILESEKGRKKMMIFHEENDERGKMMISHHERGWKW